MRLFLYSTLLVAFFCFPLYGSDKDDHVHIEMVYGFDIEYGGNAYRVEVVYLTSWLVGLSNQEQAPFVAHELNNHLKHDKLPFELIYRKHLYGYVTNYEGKRVFRKRMLGVAGVKKSKVGPYYFSNDFRWFEVEVCDQAFDVCELIKPNLHDEPPSFLYKNKPDNISADRPSNIEEGFFEYLEFDFSVSKEKADLYLEGQRRHFFKFRNLTVSSRPAQPGQHLPDEPGIKRHRVSIVD